MSKTLYVLVSIPLCSIAFALAYSPVRAADKVINITGNGNDAQYHEDGTAKQLNVVVKVGDTVRWKNNGDRKHTATSDVHTAPGTRLFDTGDVAKNGGESPRITLDQNFYDAAAKATGTTTGERIHLGYFCAKHATLMGGKLVLEPANSKPLRVDEEEHE